MAPSVAATALFGETKFQSWGGSAKTLTALRPPRKNERAASHICTFWGYSGRCVPVSFHGEQQVLQRNFYLPWKWKLWTRLKTQAMCYPPFPKTCSEYWTTAKAHRGPAGSAEICDIEYPSFTLCRIWKICSECVWGLLEVKGKSHSWIPSLPLPESSYIILGNHLNPFVKIHIFTNVYQFCSSFSGCPSYTSWGPSYKNHKSHTFWIYQELCRLKKIRSHSSHIKHLN